VISGNITNSGASGAVLSLVKSNSSTWVLGGNNTYNGTTNINAGALNIQNATALGTTAAGTTVASGAALQLQGGISVGAESLTLSGDGVTSTGALRNISGNNSYAGAITLNAATRINSDSDLLTLSGNISGAGQNLTIGGAGNTTISGAIATTTGTLTKDGAGTLTLNASNTYIGTTTVAAGTLQANSANALGTGTAVEVTGGSLLVTADDAINGKNITLNSTSNATAGLAFQGNYNGTAGLLTLHEDSILDLGMGSVVLRFSDIVGLDDYTLKIYNWTGETLWGGSNRDNTDQIYVTANLNAPSRAGELGNISFYSDFTESSFLGTGFQLAGSGFYNNQVIPVPEAETWLAAAVLLGGLGFACYRRRKSSVLE
jgi:autotransporter-associated beta strand protein